MKTLVFVFALFFSAFAHAQLSSTLVDFGHVGWDSRTTRHVYFNNLTSQVITHFNASVSGQGFNLANNGCLTPLQPGQSCTLAVQFWGTQPGYASGNLVVYTNATNSSASLTAFVDPHPGLLPQFGAGTHLDGTFEEAE